MVHISPLEILSFGFFTSVRVMAKCVGLEYAAIEQRRVLKGKWKTTKNKSYHIHFDVDPCHGNKFLK